MNETVEQYTTRILSYLGKDDPLTILAGTAERIGTLMASVGDEQLRRSPGEGKWSIAQIVTHLADAEIVGAYRLRVILAAPGTPLQAYDQNAWEREMAYGSSDPFVSLEVFRALRVALVDLVRRMPDDSLDRYGVHEERGRESVRDLLRLYAGHDRNHLGQIERLAGQTRGR